MTDYRFESVQEVREGLRKVDYLADEGIAGIVYLADRLQKPVLVEGPAGTGKTQLAKSVAEMIGARLIRLQCYEGLDESKALYEWNYKKQLLRIQADLGARLPGGPVDHALLCELQAAPVAQLERCLARVSARRAAVPFTWPEIPASKKPAEPTSALMPYSVTMRRAIEVAFSISLDAPVVGSWNTISSATRPPIAYASWSSSSLRVTEYLSSRGSTIV